jgi:outer membrane protein
MKKINLKFLLKAPLLLGVLSINEMALAESTLFDNSIEINSINSKIEHLNLEQKINRSLFLPELSVNGGFGSEKLIDRSADTEKGPFVFLDGKLNLYRGNRDSNLQRKIQNQITIAKLQKEIKKRNLNIESFKLILEIEQLSRENSLIEDELKSNKLQEAMARKKLDAGLTTSVDILDFNLKKEILTNDIEKNILKKETLEKELTNLYGGNSSLNEIIKTISNDASKEQRIDNSTIENSPTVILARQQIEISTLDKENIKAEYLPSIDLNAKWGQITPQDKFLANKREHQIALNINIPLFTGFSTDGKFQQAVIESTQNKRELRQAEIELDSKNILGIKKIELSKKILTSLERSLTQAIKYKELTISEYKRGIKNSPDVISASDKKFELEKKILENQNELANSSYSFNETFKPYQGE